MKFRLLMVGRSRGEWADDAVADWTRRLQRHGGLEEVRVSPEKFRGDVEAVRDAEAERLLQRVGPRDRLVVLDERGERLNTDGFTSLVEAGRQTGTVVFALGGPYGHGEAMRQAAWRTVRLSDLVLNHQVARVVLVEQLYRAMMQLSGAPYHH